MNRAIVYVGALAVVMALFSLNSDKRKESRIVASLRRHWSMAEMLGYSKERRPIVAFKGAAERLPSNPVMSTDCIEPNPIIWIDRKLAFKDTGWSITIAAPHEIAHVMNCLDGQWSRPHGPQWEGAIRRLVGAEQADLIIDYQTEVAARFKQ